MRIHEITETIGDTWESRFTTHQRQQAKLRKLRTKLDAAQAKAAENNRRAAATRARDNAKITSVKRDLARPPTP